MTDQNHDLIDNPTPRCACALVLDTSHSMSGQPIEKLNEGVSQLLQELLADEYAKYSVELGIFTFGGSVKQVMNFTALQPVKEANATFTASGNTPMGKAVDAAMHALNSRKQQYKEAGVSYYQPWLILMTDGEPTDAYRDAAQRLRALAADKKVVVFGIGIGDGCNMEVLGEFCPPDRQPKKLAGLKFKDFFAWLSQSMSQVSQSTPGDSVQLPATDSWAEIKA